jgi:hypothetical protein
MLYTKSWFGAGWYMYTNEVPVKVRTTIPSGVNEKTDAEAAYPALSIPLSPPGTDWIILVAIA